MKPLFAENFSVEYLPVGKRVTVFPGGRGVGTPESYLLVPCDTPRPVEEDAPTIIIPVQSAVTTSTTQVASMVALDLADRLVGHHGLSYVNNPEVRSRFGSGEVVEVGDGSRVNPEALMQLRPQLVLVFSSGSPEYDAPAILRQSGLPMVVDASHREASPLARSEWIKFVSLFFDREAEANRQFSAMARRYEELSKLADGVELRPKVLLGAPFRGVWHVPGGRSYAAQLVADAGGDYPWAEDPSAGSIPLDFEVVWARAHDAEYWLQPSAWRSLDDGLAADPRFARFAAFRAGRVFNNDRRVNDAGGNDYWETGMLRPDLVLADLLKIFHPHLAPDHDLFFHRQLQPPQ